MPNEVLDGKRIFLLDQHPNVVDSLKLAVDNESFEEARFITVGQLKAVLGHPALSLGTPNGLELISNTQILSLKLANNISAGALSQLPDENPIYKYVNGENKWEYIYANNTVGGHHSYELLTQRDTIPIFLRTWGMTCTVFNDANLGNNGTYELKFNHVDTQLTNNANWVKTNRLEFEIINQTEGIIPDRDFRKSPVLYSRFVTKTGDTYYRVVYVNYYYDEDGNFRWNSHILIEHGYLLLI